MPGIGSYLNAAFGLGTALAGEVSNKTSQTASAVGTVFDGKNEQSLSELAMANDPMAFNTISYPSDITQNMENGHYMLFYVNVQNKSKYRYRSARGEGVFVGGKTEVKKTITEAVSNEERAEGKKGAIKEVFSYQDIKNTDLEELSYQRERIGRGGIGNRLIGDDEIFLVPNEPTGFSAQFPTTSRITDSVALYLPAVATDSASASYQGTDIGIAGLLAAGGGAFMDAMRNNDYTAAATSLVGLGEIAAQEAIRKSSALVDVALNADQGTAAALGAKAFGTAVNPFIEMIFDKMNLRDFSYTFKFQPRNQRETEEVQAIIKLFRFHMAPELKGGQNRYLTLPSTFDIHYMYQHSKEYAAENNFYSKIARCVLESVTVENTPEGVKSFASGAPTAQTMTLKFKETELLTKGKINAGY